MVNDIRKLIISYAQSHNFTPCGRYQPDEARVPPILDVTEVLSAGLTSSHTLLACAQTNYLLQTKQAYPEFAKPLIDSIQAMVDKYQNQLSFIRNSNSLYYLVNLCTMDLKCIAQELHSIYKVMYSNSVVSLQYTDYNCEVLVAYDWNNYADYEYIGFVNVPDSDFTKYGVIFDPVNFSKDIFEADDHYYVMFRSQSSLQRFLDESNQLLSPDKGQRVLETLKALENLIDKHNSIPQSVYVMEECAELIKEFAKFERGKGNQKDMMSEACDVLISTIMLIRSMHFPENIILDNIINKCERAIARFNENGEL